MTIRIVRPVGSGLLVPAPPGGTEYSEELIDSGTIIPVLSSSVVPVDGPEITTLATINWTNGLGTSETAWTDGDTSRNTICDPSTINPTVRAAADEGWTGPGNVFRAQNTTAGCGGLLLQDLMPPVTEGDIWVLRWSYKQSADQIRNHAHTIVGFSPNLVAEGKLILNGISDNVDANWNHNLGLAPSNFGWNLRNPENTARRYLDHSRWYRFEIAIVWSTADSVHQYYRIYPRVYDDTGTLIATEANYRSDYINGDFVNQLMSDYYAGGGFLRYPIGGLTNTTIAENVRDFWLGISRSYENDQGLHYWAGVNVGIANEVTYYGEY